MELERYLANGTDDDRFRVFRLGNGIYGQRQGGTNQMVRVKIPYGGVNPEQLEAFADIADTYSRGWGHITTRQNIQFHFVELTRVPELLKDLGVGRHDHPRGLRRHRPQRDGLPPRRRVPVRGPRHHAVGRSDVPLLPAPPLRPAPAAQVQDQLLRLRDRLRPGHVQRRRRRRRRSSAARRTVEAGFRVFIGGGLGANPHPAIALEDFTPRDDLLATIESVLRTFDHYGNRDNKLRARLKWVVAAMGVDEVRERVLKERRFLLGSATLPRRRSRRMSQEHGDAPAGMATGVDVTPVGYNAGVAVTINGRDPFTRWEQANVVRGNAKGTVSAVAYAKLGRHHRARSSAPSPPSSASSTPACG